MDFIVQLPRTKRGHGAIIVSVDRLTKMVHFAPTTTKVDAEDTARLFLHYVLRLHGPPESIISDRGSTFNSTFFREFARLWGSRMAMSTAYHPQTDGQTERVNRVLENVTGGGVIRWWQR
jgi:transposase InsO family protein